MSERLYKVFHYFVVIVLVILFALFSIRGRIWQYMIAASIAFLLIRLATSNGLKVTKLGVFLLTFITRFGFGLFMDDKLAQRADFEVVLKEAASGKFTDRIEYYSHYAHKFLYPFILHKLHFRSQVSIFFFQSILVAACAVLIYIIANEVVGGNAGTYGALLYVFWPAQIVYADITTEEHVAAFLTLLIVFLLFRINDRISEGFNEKNQWTIGTLLVILAGFVFGISCFFKDWGSVVLVAVLLSAILLLVHYKEASQKIAIIAAFVLLLLVRMITSKAVIAYEEHRLGIPVGNNVIIAQMYGTLDPNSSGNYNREGNEEYYAIVEKHNYDYSAANKEALGILKSKIEKDFYLMPSLLLRKGTTAYVDDAAMMFCGLVESINDEGIITNYRAITQIIWFVASVYYCMMVCFTLFGGIYNRNPKKTFIMLCLIGTIMVSLVVECQGRYKYSVEPLWCLLAAGCFVPRLSDDK